MNFSNLKIRTKLLVIGVLVTIIPLAIIMATVFSQNRKVFEVLKSRPLPPGRLPIT